MLGQDDSEAHGDANDEEAEEVDDDGESDDDIM